MNVNLMGVQKLDFENDKGEKVQGLKLHISFKDPYVSGYKCDSKFISADACKNLGISDSSLSPLIGKPVVLETDLKGKIIGVAAG